MLRPRDPGSGSCGSLGGSCPVRGLRLGSPDRVGVRGDPRGGRLLILAGTRRNLSELEGSDFGRGGTRGSTERLFSFFAYQN